MLRAPRGNARGMPASARPFGAGVVLVLVDALEAAVDDGRARRLRAEAAAA